MGFFDKLRRRRPKGSTYAQSIDGYAPVFSQFGTNIYASDAVQQAIKCIVDEMAKLRPVHVRENGNDVVPVRDSVQKILNSPNPLMTTSEFLEKTMWLLIMNYNVFIYPIFREYTDRSGHKQRTYDEIYPLNPSHVIFLEDGNGKLYVKMDFPNNFQTTLPYESLIHIRINYSMNDYMGGNESGQPDNNALLKTLELNHKMLEGIARAMNASCSINGVIQYNTMLDDGKMEDAMKKFEKKLANNASGFLPMDLKSKFIPVKRDIKVVDKDTLEFIDEKILRNFGVSTAILTGDYTKQQYEAFYQKTLEPFIVKISQAFTKKLFTENERAFGNKIRLYPKELIFLTTEQTIQVVQLLMQTGTIYENEKRTSFGYMPLEELEGKRYMSLNWVDTNIAQQYQLDGARKEDENGKEEKE